MMKQILIVSLALCNIENVTFLMLPKVILLNLKMSNDKNYFAESLYI